MFCRSFSGIVLFPTEPLAEVLLVLFLWSCGFHFSSTTGRGDLGWLEAILFSLSADGFCLHLFSLGFSVPE